MNEGKNCMTEKWLRILIYVAVVSLINSLVSLLPFIPSAVTSWIGWGVLAAVIVCMFKLAPANTRYKKAGIMRAVVLGCTLITVLITAGTLLTLAVSILSIIAVYQEYNAHSELIKEKNAKLSRQWHSLFNWSLVSGLLVGFGSTVAVVITAVAGMDAETITGIVVSLLSIPQIVIDVIYLLYLKKMTDYFPADEVVEGNVE